MVHDWTICFDCVIVAQEKTLLQIRAEDVVFHVEAARVEQLVELDGQDVRVAEDEGEDDGHCDWEQNKCCPSKLSVAGDKIISYYYVKCQCSHPEQWLSSPASS